MLFGTGVFDPSFAFPSVYGKNIIAKESGRNIRYVPNDYTRPLFFFTPNNPKSVASDKNKIFMTKVRA